MTNIYLHGILKKKFGPHFKGFVKNALSALKLIECNKPGFLKEVFDLNQMGLNYSIICDNELILNKEEFIESKKIKSIYIIPSIQGSGTFVAMGLGLVAQGSLTLMGNIVAFLVNSALSLAVSFLAASLLNSGSAPRMSGGIAVGGATASIEAKGKSYVFANKENIASQGSSISVGYGQIKANSQVISASVKSYPTNSNFNSEFTQSLFNEFYFINYIAQ